MEVLANKSLIEEEKQAQKRTSLVEIFEKINTCITNDDFKTAGFFISITRLIKTKDLTPKVTSLLFESVIKFKQNNIDSLHRITRKIFKYIRMGNLAYINNQLLMIFIKIMFKTAQLSEDTENVLLTCWMYYMSKSIFDSQSIQGEDNTYQIIKTKFPFCLKQITAKVGEWKQNCIDKIDHLQAVHQAFKNKAINTEMIEPNQTFYIVSKSWTTNLAGFLQSYLEPTEKKDNFITNDICMLYFNDDDDEYRREIMGAYPGEINNFLIISGSDHWNDPEDKHTNIYLKRDIKENKDYFIMPKDMYWNLKKVFGVFQEIERKTVLNLEQKLELEIELRKLHILFINEQIRDTQKDQLRVKSIQISKYDTFASLDAKMKRIFENVVNDDSEFEFKVFKYHKDPGELFDLLTTYTSKGKFFKIKAKELKKSECDSKLVSELGIAPDDILIVEVISKTMLVKPFIRIATESVNCSFCGILITDKRISCDYCSLNAYCSNECKSTDSAHSEYHQKLETMFNKKLSISEASKINISTFFEPNSKGGLVGLKNIDGATCFVNSALQCFAHCEDLTKYFLSKSFLEDINKNKQSTDGVVAIAYYELLKELWVGSNAMIAPWDMRNVFVSYMKRFSATPQDSLEMIMFLLDRLHDDLNVIKNKPYAEFMEKEEHETDEEASSRWMRNYKMRENSIITDLFLGQYKRTMKCNECKLTSITYDPFLHLPLNIPEKNNSKIKIKVFPNNNEYNFFNVELFEVNKSTEVKEIKNKMKEFTKFKKSEFDAILLKNKLVERVLSDSETIYDYIYTKVNFEDEEFTDFEILLYEVENSYALKNKGDFVTFYVTPSTFWEEKYYMLFKNKLHRTIIYPKAFSIGKKCRVKDLYMEVYKYYRRIIDDQIVKETESDVDTSYYKIFYENVKENNREFFESDFDKYFLGNELSGETENSDFNENNSKNRLFELFFFNNIPTPNSYFRGKPSCEFCKSKCSFCPIRFNLNSTIYELFGRQEIPREFILLADFTKYAQNAPKFYEEYIDPNNPRNNLRGDFTIYDLFDNLRVEEKITKEKQWRCDTCKKEKAEGTKKIELISLPKVLVLQIQRFKFKGYTSLIEMVNNKKKEHFVDFPLNNLDLSNQLLIGKEENNKYDLFAISRHSGPMKGGHFTAAVNNRGKWHEINDENVSKADITEISNQSAYLLFYRKIEEDTVVNDSDTIN